MKIVNIVVYLILTVILSIYNPSVNMAQEKQDVYLTLKHANIIDIEKGRVISDMTVLIKNDRIASVYKGNRTKGEVIDIQYKYLVPGLVDSHAHVTNISGSPIERSYKVLDYLLKHGITTIRDAAGNGAIMQKVQADVNHDIKTGADIYYAAFMAGDWYYNRDQHIRKEPYHPWEQLIVPGTNLDSAMKAAKECGATGVKLYHSFDGTFLKEVAAAAKRNGLLVWGHAMMYPGRPLEVVRAGVQVISHASMLSALINDPKMNYRKVPQAYKDSVGSRIDVSELAGEMKRRNVILDATLTVSEVKEQWIFELVKKLHQMGVKISAGTDKITVLTNPDPFLIEELNYFVNDCDFTPAEALKAATLISAETIGQDKNIGSIKVGKKADLLVTEQNPLEDINGLKKLSMIIKHGKVIN
ncbi:amidohydrolase family protein [Pedobacter frigidisoli]|uniref:amidohydrolase family protein n=1 Tax=Pedobacter frigidisoli TaxID=2530455 RepID=UPI002930246B|nr:amidohydrolase family protein [Pedobacter frigidisoli]